MSRIDLPYPTVRAVEDVARTLLETGKLVCAMAVRGDPAKISAVCRKLDAEHKATIGRMLSGGEAALTWERLNHTAATLLRSLAGILEAV